jgi:hypothetical protein
MIQPGQHLVGTGGFRFTIKLLESTLGNDEFTHQVDESVKKSSADANGFAGWTCSGSPGLRNGRRDRIGRGFGIGCGFRVGFGLGCWFGDGFGLGCWFELGFGLGFGFGLGLGC